MENILKHAGEISWKDRRIVRKGWGVEDWIINTHLYCLKELFFKQGKMCSWHYHKLKDETFDIIRGRVIIKWGETDDIDQARTMVLTADDCFHVPPGLRHRIIALEDALIIEASTQHFDEDVYRILVGD